MARQRRKKFFRNFCNLFRFRSSYKCRDLKSRGEKIDENKEYKNYEKHEDQSEETYGRRICGRVIPLRICGVRNE